MLQSANKEAAKPLVSVIIPTYNRCGRLEDALKSAQAQVGTEQMFDMEIIVVDDASSDGTAEMVRRYGAVRYLRHPVNRGGAAARNTGIEACRGSFVAFLDDDDVWLPHKLAVQVPALQAHPEAGGVYSHIRKEFNDDACLWPHPSYTPCGSVFRDLLLDNFMQTLSVLIRREAFAKSGYFDEQLTSSQDYDMLLRLAFHFPFIFAPGIVAVHRQRSDGVLFTSCVTGRHAENHRRTIEKALGLLADTPANVHFKREMRAVIDLQIALFMAWVGRSDQVHQHLMNGLRTFPLMVRTTRPRRNFAWVAAREALTSATPLTRAARLSHEMASAAGIRGVGFSERLALRRLQSGLWAELAACLADRDRPGVRKAAVCAALLDPTKLARRSFWQLVVHRRTSAGTGSATTNDDRRRPGPADVPRPRPAGVPASSRRLHHAPGSRIPPLDEGGARADRPAPQ
jgi:glycosyltransferase involved in cell wall biosynthesis